MTSIMNGSNRDGSSRASRSKVTSCHQLSPNRENVAQGAYRLVIPLGLVWKDEPGRQVKNFIDFLYSPAAEKIMADHGAFSALKRR